MQVVQTKGAIEFDRFRISYRVIGQGPSTVICINGAQQTMGSWSSFIQHLGKDLKIITFDFPGVGRSEIVSGPPQVTFEEQLQVIHEVIQTLESSRKVGLMGASWGGIIAAAAAARFPGHVDRLLLASFGLRPNEMILKLINEGLELIEMGRGEEVGPLFIKGFGQNLPDSFKQKITAQFQGMNERSLKALHHHAAFVRGISDARQHIQLDQIVAPTLIMNGEEDVILDPGDLAEVERAIPVSRGIRVPRTGHFLHQESGRGFLLDVYRDFFTGRMDLLSAELPFQESLATA